MLLTLCPLLAMCGSDKPALLEGSGGSTDGGGQATEITVYDLRAMYRGVPTMITEDVYLVGRIVSSDQTGNIYKSLMVEDATGGIEIKLDRTDIFRIYPRWYNVRVNCNSLVLDEYGGSMQLGVKGTENLIPQSQQASVLKLIPNSWTEVMPSDLSLSAVGPRYVNRLVRIAGVQFANEELGLKLTEHGQTTDRKVVDAAGNSLLVRTSAYAEFANYRIPDGSGYVQGILGYFNGKYQIVIIDYLDIQMDGARF